MKWILHKYHDLEDSQLRDISKLRKSFFEADSKQEPVKDEYDELSFHLLGLMDLDLVAYGRVIPPHDEFVNPYLSRIIVAEKFRNKGFGTALVNELSKKSKALFSNKITKVSSLASTLSFYKKHNFIEDRKFIDEAGVEHFILLKNDR
jgi:ElaA protein